MSADTQSLILSELTELRKECNLGFRDTAGRLATLEAQIPAITDHEARIRGLEKFRFIAAGGVAVLAALFEGGWHWLLNGGHKG